MKGLRALRASRVITPRAISVNEGNATRPLPCHGVPSSLELEHPSAATGGGGTTYAMLEGVSVGGQKEEEGLSAGEKQIE